MKAAAKALATVAELVLAKARAKVADLDLARLGGLPLKQIHPYENLCSGVTGRSCLDDKRIRGSLASNP